MHWFKRFIARLLDIQPKDLPQAAVKQVQDPQAEIARQVQQEVRRAIRHASDWRRSPLDYVLSCPRLPYKPRLASGGFIFEWRSTLRCPPLGEQR